MSDISSNENDWLLEDFGAHVGHQNVVDSAKFDVDFQAKVGKRLWRGLVDVLDLNALGGNAEARVSDALDLGVDWRFAGQDDDDELEVSEFLHQILEHRLNLVGS